MVYKQGCWEGGDGLRSPWTRAWPALLSSARKRRQERSKPAALQRPQQCPRWLPSSVYKSKLAMRSRKSVFTHPPELVFTVVGVSELTSRALSAIITKRLERETRTPRQRPEHNRGAGLVPPQPANSPFSEYGSQGPGCPRSIALFVECIRSLDRQSFGRVDHLIAPSTAPLCRSQHQTQR